MASNQYINPWHVDRCIRAMQQGGVIAYPTEAVWGVGCDPFNEEALERLLRLKSRPRHKGVILAAGSLKQVEPLLMRLTPEQRQKVEATWPGPVTWLLPDPDHLVPEWIKGKHNSVAVRVSDHPVVQALCERFGGPIVSTSANPAGADPARNVLRVNLYFATRIDAVMPGQLGRLAQPTQIRDLLTESVIRT